MVPKEQIKLDFEDSSGHFVLMVRREGTASGTGLLADASIGEFGRHDIIPGVSGDPSGYLVATKGEGNVAYIKWTVRAIFLPGKDGKPELNDNGFWEIVSATGKIQGSQRRGHGPHQIREPDGPHLHSRWQSGSRSALTMFISSPANRFAPLAPLSFRGLAYF